jgi:hypothetical protein
MNTISNESSSLKSFPSNLSSESDESNNINNFNLTSQKNITSFNNAANKKLSKNYQRLIFLPIVSSLIIISYLIFVFYVRYLFPIESKEFKNSFYFITFLFIMIMSTYFLAAFTNPYQTNVDKYFDASNNIMNINNQNNISREIKSLNPEEWFAFCNFCNKKKFIRSSHCRICKNCIIFRDHHCPWIANCVGCQNMQYFMNFLFWGVICIGYFLWYLLKFFLNKSKLNELHPNLKVNFFKSLFFFIIGLLDFLVWFSLIGLIIQISMGIYNNFPQNERRKFFSREFYYPCFNYNNQNASFNEYNVGFLTHFYYLIGPTLLHFFFPLPKFQTLIINENSPIFRKSYQPSRIGIVKFLVSKDKRFEASLTNKENEPGYFLELSHKYYDGKEIV